MSFEPEDSYENLNPAPMVAFIQKYNYKLSIKPINAIDQNDAIIYAFIVLGIEVLEQAVGEKIDFFLDPDKVRTLESKKRTGFLQSVLLGDSPYTFSHKGRNEKADRQYIASPFYVNDKKYLYMVMLDNSILDETTFREQIGTLADDFEYKLQKCFKSLYTEDIRSKGEDNYGIVEN